MSLFGRTKCTKAAIKKNERPRWVICELSNQRYRSDRYTLNFGPSVYERARHTTKEFAIAEMNARLPRLEKGHVLLLWDDECEEWVDWEATP